MADHLPKQFKRARKESIKAGWTWETRRTLHIEVRNPEGEFICSISSTLYDGPVTKQILSRLRKFDCPGTT